MGIRALGVVGGGGKGRGEGGSCGWVQYGAKGKTRGGGTVERATGDSCGLRACGR